MNEQNQIEYSTRLNTIKSYKERIKQTKNAISPQFINNNSQKKLVIKHKFHQSSKQNIILAFVSLGLILYSSLTVLGITVNEKQSGFGYTVSSPAFNRTNANCTQNIINKYSSQFYNIKIKLINITQIIMIIISSFLIFRLILARWRHVCDCFAKNDGSSQGEINVENNQKIRNKIQKNSQNKESNQNNQSNLNKEIMKTKIESQNNAEVSKLPQKKPSSKDQYAQNKVLQAQKMPEQTSNTNNSQQSQQQQQPYYPFNAQFLLTFSILLTLEVIVFAYHISFETQWKKCNKYDIAQSELWIFMGLQGASLFVGVICYIVILKRMRSITQLNQAIPFVLKIMSEKQELKKQYFVQQFIKLSKISNLNKTVTQTLLNKQSASSNIKGSVSIYESNKQKQKNLKFYGSIYSIEQPSSLLHKSPHQLSFQTQNLQFQSHNFKITPVKITSSQSQSLLSRQKQKQKQKQNEEILLSNNRYQTNRKQNYFNQYQKQKQQTEQKQQQDQIKPYSKQHYQKNSGSKLNNQKNQSKETQQLNRQISQNTGRINSKDQQTNERNKRQDKDNQSFIQIQKVQNEDNTQSINKLQIEKQHSKSGINGGNGNDIQNQVPDKQSKIGIEIAELHKGLTKKTTQKNQVADKAVQEVKFQDSTQMSEKLKSIPSINKKQLLPASQKKSNTPTIKHNLSSLKSNKHNLSSLKTNKINFKATTQNILIKQNSQNSTPIPLKQQVYDVKHISVVNNNQENKNYHSGSSFYHNQIKKELINSQHKINNTILKTNQSEKKLKTEKQEKLQKDQKSSKKELSKLKKTYSKNNKLLAIDMEKIKQYSFSFFKSEKQLKRKMRTKIGQINRQSQQIDKKLAQQSEKHKNIHFSILNPSFKQQIKQIKEIKQKGTNVKKEQHKIYKQVKIKNQYDKQQDKSKQTINNNQAKEKQKGDAENKLNQRGIIYQQIKNKRFQFNEFLAQAQDTPIQKNIKTKAKEQQKQIKRQYSDSGLYPYKPVVIKPLGSHSKSIQKQKLSTLNKNPKDIQRSPKQQELNMSSAMKKKDKLNGNNIQQIVKKLKESLSKA